MTISLHRQRLIARFALAMAVLGTTVGQLHALARHATTDGKSDLELPLTRAWAEPAAELFRPILDWSDPDTVYLAYGKIWFPVFAAFTLAAFVVYKNRRPAGFEKWSFRVALTGYLIATASTVGGYYTPYLDESFLFLGLPGLLVTALGSTALGLTMLKNRLRPALSAWLLVVFIPGFIAIPMVTSMGSVVLPLAWAWALAARFQIRQASELPDVIPSGSYTPRRG
ncbi:MAG: hypothetical protein M3Q98_11855 [Actinomycetota bacterium]|nr:hypothetical protein [Actinomycetota bacterium]